MVNQLRSRLFRSILSIILDKFRVCFQEVAYPEKDYIKTFRFSLEHIEETSAGVVSLCELVEEAVQDLIVKEAFETLCFSYLMLDKALLYFNHSPVLHFVRDVYEQAMHEEFKEAIQLQLPLFLVLV